MPEETPSLHIDTDWKRQAQEEKRKLAEQEKARGTSTAPPPGTASAHGAAGMPEPPEAPASRAPGARSQREVPQASFATLVSSIMTQALFYLGELAPRGGEPMVNLDMAKHQIDLLSVLDEKTKNNLTPEEKRLLDTALYELRMRYVNLASQQIT